MRSRIIGLVLGAFLIVGMAGCSKKAEQAQTPPADQSAQTAQTAPAGTPAAQSPAPSQNPPAQQPAAPAPVAEAPAPPPPPPLVVPAGASLLVRLGSTLDTKTAEAGQPFNGTLAKSVVVDGEVAIPSGAGVSGSVVESKSPGRFKGEGILTITLNSINVGGVPTEIATSSFSQTVKGKGKRTAVAVGGGTGAGALIGGIAGGGKGALIGGLVGAGAGTAGAAFTGNKDLQIPAETVVTFRLANSITVHRSAKKAKSEEAPAQ
jgi:hypothetical protein